MPARPLKLERWARFLVGPNLTSFLVFVVVFGGFCGFWFERIRGLYYPVGDDFALLVNSAERFHPSWSDWFVKGFRQYWEAYPDVSTNSNVFIRPLVNATFFVDSLIFRDDWSLYLLPTYAFVASLAALTYRLARNTLELRWPLSLFAAFCVAVAPAVDGGAIFDPAFAFDLLASCFVLLGVACLISERLFPCWVFLTLALFTKETAAFAPLFAGFIVMGRKGSRPMRHRLLAAASFLMSVLAWCILHALSYRQIVMLPPFGTGRHGRAHALLVDMILGLSRWPLAATVTYDPHIRIFTLAVKSLSILNLLFWSSLAIGFVRLPGKRQRISAGIQAIRSAQGSRFALAVLSAFSLGGILLPLVSNLPRRFGGVFYPLFLLSLTGIVAQATMPILRRTALSLLVCAGVTGTLLMAVMISYSPPLAALSWAGARSYIQLIRSSRDPVLLSIGDFSGGAASGENVARFAGYKGKLIRIVDLDWDPTCRANLSIAQTPRDRNDHTFTLDISHNCGEFKFGSLPLPTGPVCFSRDLAEVWLGYCLNRPPAKKSTPSPLTNVTITIRSHVKNVALLWGYPGSAIYYKTTLP